MTSFTEVITEGISHVNDVCDQSEPGQLRSDVMERSSHGVRLQDVVAEDKITRHDRIQVSPSGTCRLQQR